MRALSGSFGSVFHAKNPPAAEPVVPKYCGLVSLDVPRGTLCHVWSQCSTWNIVSRSVSVFHVEHCVRIVLEVPHKPSAMSDLSVSHGTFSYTRPAVPQERSQLGGVRALQKYCRLSSPVSRMKPPYRPVRYSTGSCVMTVSIVPRGTSPRYPPVFHVEHCCHQKCLSTDIGS